MSNDQSHQLINLLQTSKKTPAEQLFYFFELIENAPGILLQNEGREEVLLHLAALARSLKIHHPEIFAQQIFFMATEAQEKQLGQPRSRALKHAQVAAKALITAQSRNHLSRNGHLYAMTASFFLVFAVSSMFLSNVSPPFQPEQLSPSLAAESNHDGVIDPPYNPKRLAEILSTREKMRHGTCKFPEALMLAEADRSIYLRTVVYGDVSYDFKEQETTTRLMQSVPCDYTPILMKNSIS